MNIMIAIKILAATILIIGSIDFLIIFGKSKLDKKKGIQRDGEERD